jgi:PAS domain S-box-containing protein
VTSEKGLAENANVQARGIELAVELLDSLPDPVIGCDPEGTVVYWSPAAESAYGYTREEALGRRAASLLHTRFPAPLLEIAEELADLGHWEGRLEHRCKGGRAVRVESRWVARRDGQGATVGRVAIERELAGEASDAAADPGARAPAAAATEGLQVGDPTARTLAHDLNNALAIVVNYTAFVTAELDAPADGSGAAMRADLQQIQAAAERALEATRRLAGEL